MSETETKPVIVHETLVAAAKHDEVGSGRKLYRVDLMGMPWYAWADTKNSAEVAVAKHLRRGSFTTLVTMSECLRAIADFSMAEEDIVG